MSAIFNISVGTNGALAAIKGDSPLGASNQAIVIANCGEGAFPASFEQFR